MRGVVGVMFTVAVVACAALSAARGDDFPSKPITIMVGLAPGGITDVTARLYAEAVSRSIGQRITIENRSAAAGALAAAAVQNAPPDGTMLLVFSGSQHATVAAMGSAPYDPVKGFSFITVLFNSVVAFVVPPDSPAETLEALFELGRKRAGGLSMGTPGLGSRSQPCRPRALFWSTRSCARWRSIAKRVGRGFPTCPSWRRSATARKK